TVLAAAAAVLVASASGALHPHNADAATPPANGAPAPAASTGTRVHGARSRTATAITHLPTNVSDPTRGVAIRLTGEPRPARARPRLSPATAGTWTDIGNYEFFHPVSTLEPCTKYSMAIPAATRAAHHRRLGATRRISFTVACPGLTAVQEAL